jgi:hypothetical protein
MEIYMKLKWYTTTLLFFGVILSACSPTTPVPLKSLTETISAPGEAATVTAQPTDTTGPIITDTPNPTALPTETILPSTLPAETSTPSSIIPGTTTPATLPGVQVIPTLNAYCRKGPNTLYDIVTFIQKGTAYEVVGRDSQNAWWLINAPGVSPCWVGAANVNVDGAAEQALVVQGQPLPDQPGLFESSGDCNTILKTYGVRLDWSAAQGATGYRIYRNGAWLTSVAGSVTAFHDDAPMNLALVYDLEAFNNYGVAVRVQTSAPACK